MSGFKRATALTAVVLTTILLSPGNPPAASALTSGGDGFSPGSIHCC